MLGALGASFLQTARSQPSLRLPSRVSGLRFHPRRGARAFSRKQTLTRLKCFDGGVDGHARSRIPWPSLGQLRTMRPGRIHSRYQARPVESYFNLGSEGLGRFSHRETCSPNISMFGVRSEFPSSCAVCVLVSTQRGAFNSPLGFPCQPNLEQDPARRVTNSFHWGAP